MKPSLFCSMVGFIALSFVLTNAQAAEEKLCDLAEQLTIDKMDPSCRAQFIKSMKNEQDKVDLEKLLTGWKPPQGLEISDYGTHVVINDGDKSLRIGLIATKPLMLVINDRFYLDDSKETSFSRRIEKVLLRHEKAEKTARNKKWWTPLLLETADAWGLPPDPSARVGYTFMLHRTGSNIQGTARDLLGNNGWSRDDKLSPAKDDYAPDRFQGYLWNAPERLMHGMRANTDQFQCIRDGDGKSLGIKQGTFRIKSPAGDERGVIARPISQNEFAIKGVLPDLNKEIRIKIVPQGVNGITCIDRQQNGIQPTCAQRWTSFKATLTPEEKRRMGNNNSCGRLGPKEADCREHFAKLQPAHELQIVDDKNNAGTKFSGISTCENAECTQFKAVSANDLVNNFDPRTRGVANSEGRQTLEGRAGEAQAARELYASKLLSYGFTGDLCPQARNGRHSCRLPNQRERNANSNRNLRRNNSDEWRALVAARTEANRLNNLVPTTQGQQNAVAAEENRALQGKAKELHARLHQIGVGMMIYGTMCRDPQGRREANGYTRGTQFSGEVDDGTPAAR